MVTLKYATSQQYNNKNLYRAQWSTLVEYEARQIPPLLSQVSESFVWLSEVL